MEIICKKCKISKDLEEFHFIKSGCYDKLICCKECFNKPIVVNIKQTKEEKQNKLKLYKEKNKLKLKKKSLEYYTNNREKILKHGKEYYKINREKIIEYGKFYRINNKDKFKEYNKKWNENNKDKNRAYSRNRYKKSLELATIKWMRNFLYRTEKQGFKKSKLNTLTEFGYTPKQLIQRIECQFKFGMSWNNRNEWDIDHKKPISAFKEGTNPKTINMLSNLQPLWSKENLSKGNKY